MEGSLCGRGTSARPVLPQARVGLKGASLPLWRLRWAPLSPCAAAEPRRGHPCDIPLPEGRASGRGQPLAAPCPGAAGALLSAALCQSQEQKEKGGSPEDAFQGRC